MARHPKTAVFVLQYLYGARVAGAVAFGLTDFSFRRFVLYEAVNCALWAAAVTFLGYAAGEELHEIFGGSVRWIWTAVSAAVVVLILHAALQIPVRQAMNGARKKKRT